MFFYSLINYKVYLKYLSLYNLIPLVGIKTVYSPHYKYAVKHLKFEIKSGS